MALAGGENLPHIPRRKMVMTRNYRLGQCASGPEGLFETQGTGLVTHVVCEVSFRKGGERNRNRNTRTPAAVL